jgi:hypothetical protein
MNKLILTDADGVLLNWLDAFDTWMADRGFEKGPEQEYDLSKAYDLSRVEISDLIKFFNESAAIGYLGPWVDSMKYVRKLHEEYGYRFRVITSLSNDLYAAKARVGNLKALFGTAIESVTCLECGANKVSELTQYADTGMYWIEDKPENAQDGADLGLNAILVRQSYNLHAEVNDNVTCVYNWREIYEHITGQYA